MLENICVDKTLKKKNSTFGENLGYFWLHMEKEAKKWKKDFEK